MDICLLLLLDPSASPWYEESISGVELCSDCSDRSSGVVEDDV